MKTRNIYRDQKRDGISIIEVLTSMAVATIGVFGIMVMIPFAVKQSHSGLDNDAANALGRNAIEEMKIQGLLNVEDNGDFSRLAIFADDGSGSNDTIQSCSSGGGGFAAESEPGLFHFDPIGFADGRATTLGFADGLTSTTIADPNGAIEIFSTTATRNATVAAAGLVAGGPFTFREASRLCRSRDQLFHSEDPDNELELAPPQPLYDLDGTAQQIKRQFSGRISWSAFMVPEKDPFVTAQPVNRMRSYALVYRDRYTGPPVPPAVRVANRNLATDPGPGTCYDYYQTNMAGTGFVNAVSQITFPAGTIDTDELVRGDWVMLLNRLPEPIAGTVPPSNMGDRAADEGYRIQIMFAKVNRVADDSVTVEGGSFDFVTAGRMGPGGNPASTNTYMVHLKNVVNVFERSVDVQR